MKVHLATSRPIGEKCIRWAEFDGFEFSSMEDCDVFISVMYDKLVSEEFIASKKRCVNFHPGLLPEQRGSGAFSWSIINGDRFCGVTLHELETDIDSGPIIETAIFEVEPTDTAETLYEKGMNAIFDLFRQFFGKIIEGSYETMPQDSAKAKVYYRRDLQRQRDLTRFVRAFTFDGKEPAFYIRKDGTKMNLEL